MGNYRFRFSDMIPNAWFYKLKDMNKSRKQCSSHNFKRKTDTSTTTASQRSSFSQSRYSYYFKQPIRQDHKFCVSPEFLDLPRKSSKKTSKRKTVYKPSPKFASFSAAPRSHVHSSEYSSSPLESSTEGDFNEYPESESDHEDDVFSVPDSVDHQVASWSSSCNCKGSSSTADIVLDMNEESYDRKIDNIDGFDPVFELDLPPIITKAANFKEDMIEVPDSRAHSSFSVKTTVKEASTRAHRERKTSPISKKSSSNSPGIRLRSNSPRIASKKLQANGRKSTSSRNKILSESFAVVKCSVDPLNDFRESMMEMIFENKIEASKDLEELLACYLSLNSKEYHTLIVKAFEQIWFDLIDA